LRTESPKPTATEFVPIANSESNSRIFKSAASIEQRDRIKPTPLQAESPKPTPTELVPITNSESNPQIFKKATAEKGSRERSRRSNTVAITRPEFLASTKSPIPWKPSSFSATFQVKTENDRKFQNFFSHNQSEDSNSGRNRRILLPTESEPPGGSGMKWTNKFSNIRSAFESKPEEDTKSPARSRRTSGEDSAGSHVTAANLRVQLTSGNVCVTTVEPKAFFSSTVMASRSPQPLEKSRLHSLAPFSNPQAVPDPPSLLRDASRRTNVKEFISKDINPINTWESNARESNIRESITNNVQQSLFTKKHPIMMTNSNKESLSKNIEPAVTREAKTNSFKESTITKKDSILKTDKKSSLVKRSVVGSEQSVQLSKESTDKKTRRLESRGGIATVSSAARIYPLDNSSRHLLRDISSSSVWTTASVGSFDFKDEKGEEDDYGDDEASSSSSSDEDNQQGQSSSAEGTCSRTNSTGINRLSKLIKKYSSTEDLHQDCAPQPPHGSVPVGRFTSWNPPVVSISSPGVFKSLSNQFIPTGDWRCKSGDIASIEKPMTPPPIPPRQLKPNPPPGNETYQRPQTLCGLKSSSGSALNTLTGYVDPPGPTLVGLVARNVRNMASTSSNSITDSAMNFAVSVSGVQANPANDCSPTSMIMKSVSSSRIVSEAKEQLSKRPDFLESAPSVRSRPQSLLVPSPTPPGGGEGVQRRSSARVVGNKQYEASMSPESAEKKQRELSKFFNDSTPAVTPTERSSSASKVGSSPVQVRFRARSAAAAGRPRAVSEGASLGFHSPPDDVASDVDELFDRLLSTDHTSDTHDRAGAFKTKSRRESSSPRRNVDSQSLDETAANGDPSGHLSAKSKFNDRRRVWEQSSKIHLNESIGLISPNAISNQSGRTFSSSVSTKSEVITRRTSVQTTRNQSAFSKFQQLDQSVKSTPR